MKWLIYKHTLLTDCEEYGWSYIGLTCYDDPRKRWGNNGSFYKTKGNTVFWQAICKYGWDNFSHEIIEDNIFSAELANKREMYWIAFFHTYIRDVDCKGYNMTLGGEEQKGPHSEEYNRKLSLSMGGIPIMCIETQEVFYGLCAVKRLTGIRHAEEVCQGKRKVAGGYHWAYVTDTDKINSLSEFVGQPQNINKKAKRKVQCVETGEIFESIRSAMAIHKCCIPKALSGERELAGGYHWRYVDD